MHEISKVGTIYNIFDMMKKRNMGVWWNCLWL